MKLYSKRAFIKLLGLGILSSTFLTYYSSCTENKTDDAPEDNEGNNKANIKTSQAQENVTISESDIIYLNRNDATFANYNTYFNARIQQLPKIIAICFTNLGIQHALITAKEKKLPFVIKSGGHHFECFSNINDGMVINVSQMKDITWLSDNVVKIEAGCVLSEIHTALFEKQRMIPAGSCGTVGISGLTLGGGYGFFSRKYGLTCDQVIDFEFVDANGNIKKASENAEVLWAMKGGGNGNFGVISSITFNTQPMPSKFAAHTLKFRNLDASRFEIIAAIWFDCYKKFNDEDFSAFILNGKTLTILATTFGNRDQLRTSIEQLIALADNHSFSDTALPTAMKRYYGRKGPIYFKNASAGLYKSYEEIQPILKTIFEQVITHKGLIYQINTLGGGINDANFENKSCYPHRALPFLSELQAYWDKPNQATKLLQGFQFIQDIIFNHGISAQYFNYPDINFNNWQQAYFGDNYSKLQKIKNNIDPDNFFNYKQSIEIH